VTLAQRSTGRSGDADRFVVTAIMVALMTYVVMPRYSKLARRWLYR